MKKNNYVLHALAIPFLLAVLFNGGCDANAQRRKILHHSIDERGLISVEFTEKKDTLGFDYLTRAEFRKEFGNIHICKWQKCPYFAVHRDWYGKVVKKYTGQGRGEDGFTIDLLHLRYPDEEYDQLDDRLNNLKNK